MSKKKIGLSDKVIPNPLIGSFSFFVKNGFNPIWEETAEFRLVYPELVFVEFRVKSGDYAKTDDHLGSFIAPFTSLRQGYRHVPLENYAGIRLTPASLFTHVCVLNSVQNKNKVNQP